MRIAILGTGRMARALGHAFHRVGHAVFFGSRSPNRARELAESVGSDASGGTYREAADWGELAALASLWRDIPDILRQTGPWRGRILLDCSNPEAADSRALEVGHTTSGAEQIAAWAADARVVKAFNHVYAELVDEGAAFGSARASVFLCGDEPSARRTVARLVEQCGFEPVDSGALTSARMLEPVAALMVELVRGQGKAPGGVGLKFLQRD